VSTSPHHDKDCTDDLAAQVAAAFEAATPLAICGAGTKSFLGEQPDIDQRLDLTAHRGIVSYEPGELVLTVRAGTPLTDIEAALDNAGQSLAFEPPHFGEGATIGGTIATNLSGPARPFTGAARDFVLGTRIINGRGEPLRFGGEVMKNVAGYDVSRLMAGAFGTLGVLLEVSLKVLPVPRSSQTRVFEHDQTTALRQFSQWGLKPWPITAATWVDGRTYLRLAGASSSVAAAATALGGDALSEDAVFWRDIREQQHAFFNTDTPLWRLSVPPAITSLDLDGQTMIDWGGALRWLSSPLSEQQVRECVARHGGHATLYRGDAVSRLHPLPHAMQAVQTRLKASLDPAGILNPGRMYAGH